MSHSRISAGLDGFRLAQERQGVDEPVDTVGKQTAIVDTHMKPGEDRDIQRHRTRQPRVHLLFRLAPARLTHCMRWHGACARAHEIATDYANRRHAFGKPLVDHEGVGFMLAENLIDLKQAELMIDWCADVLDTGVLGTVESSMAKVAVSEALMRIADRCVQVMGATGVSGDTIVEQVFREVRAFRIYDGPTEVHKWSLAKKVKRDWKAAQG